MPKWEYCKLMIGPEDRNVTALVQLTERGTSGREVKRDRKKGDESLMDAVDRTIAELGASGWELAIVLPFSSPGINPWEWHVLYFKRSLDD